MQCHGHKHSHSFEEEMEFFLGKLRDTGSRITNQRKALASTIIKFERPFTAEELHSKVRAKGIDLVTVYRSLASFAEFQIVSTVDFQDGTQRYEYKCSGEKGHHHHIICRKCKKADPVDFCAVEGQEKFIERLGYSNVSHKLEFFGLCKVCSRKAS